MPQTNIEKPKRRRLRVSLRALMVLVTLLCLGLAWWVNEAKVQKDAVLRLRELGNQVIYRHDTDVGGKGEVDAPKWLVDFLGIDFFSAPKVLYLTVCTNDDLLAASRLKHVRKVTLLDRRADDLSPLKKLELLDTLVLFNSTITEADLLSDLSNLEFMWLNSTQIIDLSPLKKLRKLRRLHLSGNFAFKMTSLAELESLATLRIINRNSPFDFESLGRLKSLESIWLQNVPVDHIEWVKDLKLLKYVAIRETSVSDLSPLMQLTNLERVDIGRRNIGLGKSGVAELRMALPNCKISHAW
jgi:internalin A